MASKSGALRGDNRFDDDDDQKDEGVESIEQRTTEIKKEEARARSTAHLRQSYYCDSCNKQYSNYTEFDNHVNSYDHAHKQRFKNLKAQDFNRKMGGKKRRLDREAEEEAKRMNLMIAQERAEAEAKRKSKGSGGFKPVGTPSFKPMGESVRPPAPPPPPPPPSGNA